MSDRNNDAVLLQRTSPLLEQSGHCCRAQRCPLSGVKRTLDLPHHEDLLFSPSGDIGFDNADRGFGRRNSH